MSKSGPSNEAEVDPKLLDRDKAGVCERDCQDSDDDDEGDSPGIVGGGGELCPGDDDIEDAETEERAAQRRLKYGRLLRCNSSLPRRLYQSPR